MWQIILASLQLGQKLNQAQNNQSNQISRYQTELDDFRLRAQDRRAALDEVLTKNELLAYSQNVDPFSGSNAAVAKENIRKKKLLDERDYQLLNQATDELKRQSDARLRNLALSSLLFGASKVPTSSASSSFSSDAEFGGSTNFTSTSTQANPYIV